MDFRVIGFSINMFDFIIHSIVHLDAEIELFLPVDFVGKVVELQIHQISFFTECLSLPNSFEFDEVMVYLPQVHNYLTALIIDVVIGEVVSDLHSGMGNQRITSCLGLDS